MTCLNYQYSGPKSKTFNKIDVHKLSVREIREMVSDVVSDEDKLYFAVDGVTLDSGFKLLLHDSDVLDLVKGAEYTGVCKLHVFHSWRKADPPPAPVSVVGDVEGGAENVEEVGDVEGGAENVEEVGEGCVLGNEQGNNKRRKKLTPIRKCDKGKQVVQ